jgi:NitT/TauT family transport system substrate-binding protein
METKPMTITRRGFGALVAGSALAMPAIVNAQAKKSLIIAEPLHGVGYLPLYVATRKNLFAPYGLDVRIVTMDSNGSAHTNAVLSGQAFAFIGGPEHNAFAKAKGAELRAVANVVDRGNVYFMARDGVTPGDDLHAFFKGRSIATGFFGGTPNSITRYTVIKLAGLQLSDVKMMESTAPGDLVIVKSGQADIGVGTEPQVTQGISQGIWQEPFINIPKRLGPYAYSTLNVLLETIHKDPDTVKGFVHGVMDGLKLTYADKDEAGRIARAEFPTMPEADMKATLTRSFADELWSKDGSISHQSWDTAKDVVMTAGILKENIPYDDVIDMQFLPKSA